MSARMDWSQQVEQLRALLTRIPTREEGGEAFLVLAGDVYRGAHKLLAATRTAVMAELASKAVVGEALREGVA